MRKTDFSPRKRAAGLAAILLLSGFLSASCQSPGERAGADSAETGSLRSSGSALTEAAENGSDLGARDAAGAPSSDSGTAAGSETIWPYADPDALTPLEISIGYWDISAMTTGESDPLRDLIEQQFAIRIDPISVDWNNYKDYYQMHAATDSLPDVFATVTISSSDSNDSAFYETMIESGSISPLPDDLSAWPHLQALMEQLGYTRYKDGHYYAIPRMAFLDPTLSSSDAAMIVRRDWMENLGLKNPTNLDEFIDMTTAFAADDPDGDGKDDTIGYNVNALNALGKWVMLGIAPDCNVYSWIEDADGDFIPSWTTDQFRDVVDAYRRMYESGGLDPDFYSKNPKEIVQDFAEGKLGCLEYKSSPSTLLQLEEAWEAAGNPDNFDTCVDVLPIFAAPDGKHYSNTSAPFWSESYISSHVDAEKMDRILTLYDFLLSESGQRLVKYGLEGVDYEIAEDGSVTCLLDTSRTSLTEQLKEKYPSLALFPSLVSWGGTDADFDDSEINETLYGRHCVELAAKDLAWNRENTIAVERPVEFQIFPKEPSEEFSTSNALSAFIQCIIGTGDAVQMWEDTLDQMRADGLAEYIERQNEAYRAWQGERDTTVSESSKTGAGEETAEEPTISQ